MIEIPTTKESLSKLFYYIIKQFNVDQFPNFNGVYQFYLEENSFTYNFYIVVSEGKAEYREGIHNSPSLTIFSPVSVWYDICSEKLNGAWGWLTGKYQIKGSIYYLLVLKKLFKKKFNNQEIPGIDDSVKDFEVPKKRRWKKPDEVLIINGSPRKRDGFTYFYLRHLIKGIEKANVIVETVDLYDTKIQVEPCRGCFNCWLKTKGSCIITDDANELVQKIKNSYLTIFAFPLYIDSIPGKLKSLIDRLFIMVMPVFAPYKKLTRHPLWECQESYFGLFLINGFPEIEHFKPIIDVFQGVARNSHRPLVASILRPGAESLFQAPYYSNYLKKVLSAIEQAGTDLVEKGNISKTLLDQISSDFGVKKEIWRQGANLHWYLRSEEVKNK